MIHCNPAHNRDRQGPFAGFLVSHHKRASDKRPRDERTALGSPGWLLAWRGRNQTHRLIKTLGYFSDRRVWPAHRCPSSAGGDARAAGGRDDDALGVLLPCPAMRCYTGQRLETRSPDRVWVRGGRQNKVPAQPRLQSLEFRRLRGLRDIDWMRWCSINQRATHSRKLASGAAARRQLGGGRNPPFLWRSRMWKALRGRRRAVRGRAGAGGLRRGGIVGLLPLERDPILVLLLLCWRFRFPPIPSDHAEPRNASSCRACLAAPRFLRSSGGGSGTTMNDDGWGGTDQLHSHRRKKRWCGRTGHSSESRLLSLAKRPQSGLSRDTAALAPPEFSNINRATRPPFPSFSFFFFVRRPHTIQTPPCCSKSWLFGTIMDIVASVVAQSKHIAKLASLTSQSTEKHPPRARWWY